MPTCSIPTSSPPKAVAPLEAALLKAPADVRLNQRLAVLYRRENRLPDAARCCVVLQKMFDAYGHPDRAQEFGSLAMKYAGQAGVRVPDVDVRPYLPDKKSNVVEMKPATVEHEFAIEVEGPEPAAQPSVNEFDLSGAAEVTEIDLSEDWDAAAGPVGGRRMKSKALRRSWWKKCSSTLRSRSGTRPRLRSRSWPVVAPNFSKLPEWRQRLANASAGRCRRTRGSAIG